MTDTQIKIREIVKDMVSQKIVHMINYDLSGTEFLNEVVKELPDEFVGGLWDKTSKIDINQDLVNQFIDNITDHVCDTIEVEE
jgi:hypothetical protein